MTVISIQYSPAPASLEEQGREGWKGRHYALQRAVGRIGKEEEEEEEEETEGVFI